MVYTTLISTAELAAHLDNPEWLIADCRFALARPDEKQDYYLKSHIPGAVYFHLDKDLSAPIIPGKTGRHPLPSPEESAQRLGAKGIAPGMQVVVYDDLGGSLSAVRLWWMLRWLGHTAVAVLDGGWQKWLAEEKPTSSGQEIRPSQAFAASPRQWMFLTTEQVDNVRQDPSYRIFDVRTAERYRGEVEPIDPVAGHIPGAISAPYLNNLDDKGCFLSPEVLRAHYQPLLGDIPPERVVFYCGSGVTSIHSILAVMHAGLGEARLYAGSWSEWIADPNRPIAKGEG
jgi:thiosulfate/3-mercaptopyruvate sulfurtransferase